MIKSNIKKDEILFLILGVVCIGLLIFFTTLWYTNSADVREAEAVMESLRNDIEYRDVGTITGDDGIEYIEYNPYTPYFLGHDEFFCWMQIDDTSIDYPVAQAPADDEYFYLTHNFTGSANRYGCPYVISDQREDDDIIYISAHNNANATMFGTFVNFNDEEYFNEHWSLTLDFADVRREYEIFAILDIGLNDGNFEYWDVLNFNDTLTEENFLNQVLNMSYIKRYNGIDNLTGSGQYVVMMTCEYTHNHGRRMVFARLINEIPYDPVVNDQIIQHEGR